MGSYLSLYNNTPDTWMVKIIPVTWNWTSLTDVAEGIVRRINTELTPTPQLRLAPDNPASTPDSRVLVKSGMTDATRQRMAVLVGLPTSSSWASVFTVWGSRYMEDYEGCTELRRGSGSTQQTQQSGPTDGSKNIYHMQPWINAYGLNGAAGLTATQSAEAQLKAGISVDWLKVFEETRLEEKQKELKAAGKDHDDGIVEEHAAE